VVNPLDLYALETALRLKEQYGGTVTALSMGPPQAKRVLKEAEAMGCDNAVLVSDRKFGGADTWATSYTLATAIAKIGGFDLIITGERATDGDTAQVGPGIAAHLDLPLATYVSTIREIKDGRIYPERLTEEGYEQLSLPLPCLLTVVKEIGVPRLPTLTGKIKSRELEIPLYSTENMDLKEEFLGLKGSPTRVVKIESPKVTRGGKLVNAAEGGEVGLKNAVDALMALLQERSII
jgi:electron transfer flavoprotein beta subunit